MSMKKIWSKIVEVNKVDDANPEKLLTKTIEELGEYAETMHWESGYKNTHLSTKKIKKSQLEEGIDTIICIMAALDKQGHSYDKKMKKMFIKKINKWKKKYE